MSHSFTKEQQAAVRREVRGFLARCFHPQNAALSGLPPLALALAVLSEIHSQLVERGLLDSKPDTRAAA